VLRVVLGDIPTSHCLLGRALALCVKVGHMLAKQELFFAKLAQWVSCQARSALGARHAQQVNTLST
jgi:hypothetical protein